MGSWPQLAEEAGHLDPPWAPRPGSSRALRPVGVVPAEAVERLRSVVQGELDSLAMELAELQQEVELAGSLARQMDADATEEFALIKRAVEGELLRVRAEQRARIEAAEVAAVARVAYARAQAEVIVDDMARATGSTTWEGSPVAVPFDRTPSARRGPAAQGDDGWDDLGRRSQGDGDTFSRFWDSAPAGAHGPRGPRPRSRRGLQLSAFDTLLAVAAIVIVVLALGPWV